jgi:hypothetical protein
MGQAHREHGFPLSGFLIVVVVLVVVVEVEVLVVVPQLPE